MTNHPITPPPELVQQWWESTMPNNETSVKDQLCTQAAQWGADQELEACCEWVGKVAIVQIANNLRTARRPKPLSLKEKALKALKVLPTPEGQVTLDITDLNTIRRALEQLND
jgi:hypothetical protein